MEDIKISDLKEAKKELRKHLMRRHHELRCYLNAYADLLTDTESLSEGVKQSLQDWVDIASSNRISEIKALKNAIEKIGEQIKKQEGKK